MIEIDLGRGNVGVAQITAFVQASVDADTAEGVLVRWLDKSPLSTTTDANDRPMCDYPLSFNHCLWQWSDAGSNRLSFTVRGFRTRVRRQKLWNHVDQNDRQRVIESEKRSRYDIISYDTIKGHVNIFEDPSTGHMLQTCQLI
jgi:hypothetical protein